jgi:RHS repeat-associated protein
VAYYTTANAGAAATHFEHQDWMGTERVRTTYNGAVEGTYTSLPYGDNSAASGTDTDANHYAMLDHDSESGTDHAQFRQYGNTQGRFMSPDPYDGSYDASNPQSFNRYVYAMNNPVSNVDPSGLNSCGDESGVYTICVDAVSYLTLCEDLDECAYSQTQTGPPSDLAMLTFPTLNFSSFPSLSGGGGGGSSAPSNSPCLVGAGPLQVGQSRCANATVKCRGIETDNLGAIGFQHCDAQVTDCNGAVYSVSAGPVNNYMNSGQQAMNAWAVSPPTAPFTGNTVWQGNLTCTQSACLFETTQEWNQSVVKPLYHPVTGPNSNNFLWNTFAGCAVTALPINTWGPIW